MNSQLKLVCGIFVLFLCALFIRSGKASAASIPMRSGNNITVTLAFENPENIVGTVTDSQGNTSTVKFFDSDATDTTYKYKLTQGTCGDSTVDLSGTGFDRANLGKFPASLTNATLSSFGIPGGIVCDGQTADVQLGVADVKNAQIYFKYLDKATLQPTWKHPEQSYQKSDKGNFFTLNGQDGCVNTVVTTGTGAAGTLYEMTGTPIAGGKKASSYSALGALGLPGSCYVTAINYGPPAQYAATRFGIDTKDKNKAAADATGTTQDNTCEGNDTTGLSFIACPIVEAVDQGVNALNKLIENLLYIDVDTLFANDGQVHLAWSVIRNLCSVVLIIIMLVMVLAQALNIGPFDAYTVRKVLPRLIIAVIVAQISWDLFKWTITLSNDAGLGVSQIMYQPFGGPEAMSFEGLLNSPSIGASGATGGLFTAAAAGTLVGVAIIGSLPLIMLAGIAALSSIFLGFVVLLMRQVLIIFLMMVVPLALVLWILPGTQKYWKLWHETFSKLLIMFPLIIGLLAAGRIFAKVTATDYYSSLPGIRPIFTAAAHVFGPGAVHFAVSPFTAGVQFFIIVIGFFGPYWLIPKTFTWGGRALGAVAGFTNNANRGLFDRGRKWAGSQKEARKGWQKREATQRQADGKYSKTSRFLGKPAIDRYKTGTLAPTKANQIRAKQIAGSYEGLLNEEVKLERAGVDSSIGLLSDANQKLYRRAILEGRRETFTGRDGSTIVAEGTKAGEAQRRAVLENALAYSEFDSIQDYLRKADASDDKSKQEEAGRFRQANVSTINSVVPHLLVPSQSADSTGQGAQIEGFSFTSGKSSEALAAMKGWEIEQTHDFYQRRIADPTLSAADKDKAIKQYSSFLMKHAAATYNPEYAEKIDASGVEAIKAFVDSGTASGIITDPDVLDQLRTAYSTRNKDGTKKIV